SDRFERRRLSVPEGQAGRRHRRRIGHRRRLHRGIRPAGRAGGFPGCRGRGLRGPGRIAVRPVAGAGVQAMRPDRHRRPAGLFRRDREPVRRRRRPDQQRRQRRPPQPDGGHAHLLGRPRRGEPASSLFRRPGRGAEDARARRGRDHQPGLHQLAPGAAGPVAVRNGQGRDRGHDPGPGARTGRRRRARRLHRAGQRPDPAPDEMVHARRRGGDRRGPVPRRAHPAVGRGGAGAVPRFGRCEDVHGPRLFHR
ncbi:hypothetical protein LTR94_027646, partial [Friedmanniomyces endolithicus]